MTTDDVDHSGIAFTPDGGSIAVLAEREQGAGQVGRGILRVLPLGVGAAGGGSEVELGTLGPQAIAFGPGGELYVLAQDHGPEGKDFVARNAALYVLSAWADPEPRRLTDPETQELGGEPVPLPDGGVLLVLASRGTQQVVRVADDGVTTQLTSGDVVVSGFGVGGGTLAVAYGDPGTYGEVGVVDWRRGRRAAASDGLLRAAARDRRRDPDGADRHRARRVSRCTAGSRSPRARARTRPC